MKPFMLKFLIEVGFCFLIAFPFPNPSSGYGWIWALVALYFMRMLVFLSSMITGWTYFHLFGKDKMSDHIAKSLVAYRVDKAVEYFDAEDYLNSVGAPLVEKVKMLDSMPTDSSLVGNFDPHSMAAAVRAGLFSSEMTGVLDTYKVVDPFGGSIMLKMALRMAAIRHYRPENSRILADS